MDKDEIKYNAIDSNISDETIITYIFRYLSATMSIFYENRDNITIHMLNHLDEEIEIWFSNYISNRVYMKYNHINESNHEKYIHRFDSDSMFHFHIKKDNYLDICIDYDSMIDSLKQIRSTIDDSYYLTCNMISLSFASSCLPLSSNIFYRKSNFYKINKINIDKNCTPLSRLFNKFGFGNIYTSEIRQLYSFVTDLSKNKKKRLLKSFKRFDSNFNKDDFNTNNVSSKPTLGSALLLWKDFNNIINPMFHIKHDVDIPIKDNKDSFRNYGHCKLIFRSIHDPYKMFIDKRNNKKNKK